MKQTLCPILITTMLFPAAAFAAFNDIGIGARPLGLGGAFVALADDSNAANYNPAGLGYIEAIQTGATRAQRFNGLITANNISGILPFGRIGAIGASLSTLSEDSGIYREQTVCISYGNFLFKPLAVGANLKLFSTAFDETNEFVSENPYFTQTSSSDVSFDIGVITKPFQNLSIGASIENLLPADPSISDEHTDPVPLNIRVGIAYRLESLAEMSAQGAAVSSLLKGSLGSLEVAYRNSELYIRTGVEAWLNTSAAIRGGYALKNGSDSVTALSLGASAKIPIKGTTLQLDYGIQFLSGGFQENTTQRFSVNLIF